MSLCKLPAARPWRRLCSSVVLRLVTRAAHLGSPPHHSTSTGHRPQATGHRPQAHHSTGTAQAQHRPQHSTAQHSTAQHSTAQTAQPGPADLGKTLAWRALLFTRPHLAVVHRDSLACRTSKMRPLEAQAVARPAPARPSRVRARVHAHAHARTSPVRHRCAHARTEASSSAGPWPGQCRAMAGPVPDRGRASAAASFRSQH